MIYARMTVFFEDPFWVGLYEREDSGQYSVCKLVFGAEPKDYEVCARLLQCWRGLRFSPPMAVTMPEERRMNPKRRQREIRAGTKAQQALSLAHTEGKEARRKKTRAEREAEQERRFALRQSKRKEKHKGR